MLANDFVRQYNVHMRALRSPFQCELAMQRLRNASLLLNQQNKAHSYALQIRRPGAKTEYDRGWKQ